MPVPPKRRVAVLSTWKKRSKMRGTSSAGMPIPSSMTSTRTVPGVGAGAAHDHPPRPSLNFTALSMSARST